MTDREKIEIYEKLVRVKDEIIKNQPSDTVKETPDKTP